MTARLILTTLMLGVVLCAPAWAGRPLETEDIEIVAPGAVELELSIDYERGGDGRSVSPGGPTLNIGLLPRLEGLVSVPFIVTDPADGPSHAGFGDMIVGLKYRLLDETPDRPGVVAAVAARLPTGSERRGLGEEGADVQALAVVGKDVGPLKLMVNAGYTFVTRDRRLDVVNLNASAEVEVTDAWSIVGEIVTQVATSRAQDDQVVLRMGTIYAVREWLKLDGAVGVGVTRGTPDLLLTVGLTALFNGR